MAEEDVRTVFVTLLPPDVSERELYLCFCGFDGYERNVVVRKDPSGPANYAFVQFASHEQAREACVRSGFIFDPDEAGSAGIKVEIAKHNIPDNFLSAKRRRVDRPDRGGSGPQYAMGGGRGGPQYAASGSLPPQYAPAAFHPPPLTHVDPRVVPTHIAPLQQLPAQPAPGAKTLYITGLPPHVTKDVFAAFVDSNWQGQTIGHHWQMGKQGTGLAFVGFVDDHFAALAMQSMQGFAWEGVPVKVEWAKTEFNAPGARTRAAGQVPMLTAPMPAPPAPGAGAALTPPATPLTYNTPPPPGLGTACTLRFSRLPEQCDQRSFDIWLTSALTASPPVARSFSQGKSGKGPSAFVLFGSADVAAQVCQSWDRQVAFQGCEPISVAPARTELNPAICTAIGLDFSP